MLTSIYTSLTGLLGFSRGLDVTSNNVANLNTPGFKSSELTFRDLFYRFSEEGNGRDALPEQVGVGVDTPSTRIRFRQGELRDTGNPLDVAIDGNGFLTVNRDGEQLYTRAGQLEFGADGLLVERGSGAQVFGLNGTQLVPVSIDGLRTSPSRATTEVRVGGNLSTGSTTAQLNDIQVFDSLGRAQTLSLRFTRSATIPSSWNVEVLDAASAVLSTGEIRFQGNGSPAPGFNTLALPYGPAGAPAVTLVFDFGDPGSFSGTTNFSGGADSSLQVQSQNGFAAGSLTTATFDERGVLQLTYSNGQTASGARLALAWFLDLQALTQLGEGLFANRTEQTPTISGAQETVMGRIVAQRIELSNVELSEQFTDLIILQRGFQSSSQVTSVANEMIQQLLEIDRPR
jgi:flagellar hook protein FlgE